MRTSRDDRPLGTAERGAIFAAGLTALLATAVLVTWAAGRWSTLALGAAYVPMAPATALLFLALAGAVGFRALDRSGDPGRVPRAAVALCGAVAASAIWLLAASLVGAPLGLEEWLARTDARIGDIAVGRMSRYTALLTALLSSGAVVRGLFPRRADVEVTAALMVLGASFLILQSYFLGGPILYRTGTIPVAATTAFCLLLLATATLLVAGQDRWPVRLLLQSATGAGRVSPWAFRMLTVAIAFLVLSSGYIWHRGERIRAEDRALATLTALADLKADQLAGWYSGHLSTARAIESLPLSLTEPGRLARPDIGDAVRAELLTWLTTLRTDNDYAAVALLTPDGAPTLVSPPGHPLALESISARVARMRERPEVVFEDVHFDGDELALKLWVPIAFPAQPAASAPHWLLLEIDAERSLFPLLLDLPIPTETSEVLLWRQEGDSAVVVNVPRLSRALPLSLRYPLDPASDLSGVRAILGTEAVSEGADYRGVSVAAVGRPVPGTDWTLVAKMDRSELVAPVVRSALLTTVVSLFLLLGTVTAVYALWSRRELRLASERAAADRALREAEDRHARAMRNTADGFWDWDLEADIMRISEKWRRDLDLPDGVSAEQVFLGRIHPDDGVSVEEAVRAHLEDGVPYEIEFRMKDAQGVHRWFWARGECERDDRGRPVRMAGGITDITARREAERALLKADRILRLRSACNLTLVHTLSEEALLQGVCHVAVREGGYRMAWIGYVEHDTEKSIRAVAVSGDACGYVDDVRLSWDADHERGRGPTGRCIRSGIPEAVQDIASEPGYSPWRVRALECGFASSCAIPLRVEGEIIGALMLYSSERGAFDADELDLLRDVGTDVSFGIQAKRDARAVADQQAKLELFRQAIERSGDAFFVADADTGRFVDVNETAARQLGYTVAELKAMSPADIAPHLGEPGAWTRHVAMIRQGDYPIWRSRHMRRDGSEIPVEISFSAVEGGAQRLIVAVARDVSERDAAEREKEALSRQLEQAQKMESVGRLAGGIAHDFNNLLTVVNATADLALADMEPDAPLREDLEQIRAAGDRAARLTRQLLAFSRRQVMHRRLVDLNEVVRDFQEMIRRVMSEQVHLQVRLATRLASIDADPGQLEQVLMNLCVNARDAMPRGGTLTVATDTVTLDADAAARHVAMRPGRYVLLSVTDTGEGMDQATQAHIFEPFFTTKAHGKGTGLGLSTVYGIVKQSGGSIWVYSEVGLGTTFKVYFPVAQDSADAVVPESAGAHTPGGTETILLVEDEEPIRSLVGRILRRAGYTVLEAGSGPEALTHMTSIRGRDVRLVLTDLVMPGMSGTQLAAELQRTHPDVRVLLATGYAAEAVQGRLPQDRTWHLIGKPYAVEELLGAVRRVLEG